MTVALTVQVTVTVVARTSMTTSLVVVPLVTGGGWDTNLFVGTGTTTASGSTIVAVTLVTTIGSVTDLGGRPLVTRGGSDTTLSVSAGAATCSRLTLVAVTVVTTIRTAAVGHPGVHATGDTTDLSIAAGAATRVRATDVTLVTVASVATRGGLPGVLCRGAGAVTGLEVSTRGTTLAVARCTSITEGNSALTVVVAVGTFTGTDGICPVPIVLTGLEVGLTAVLVTDLLSACVVGLVEGSIRTMTVGLAAL